VRGLSGNWQSYRNVRQAKLGISYRVKVSMGPRPNQPPLSSVAIMEEARKPNEIIEAYTENHVGHKGDRTPGSLI